jgi:hypothetical protein
MDFLPMNLVLKYNNLLIGINKYMPSSHNNHRNIYKEHFGEIPKDKDGNPMDIHHIDGNHNNNEISNLKLVTIKEHYDIHHAQGDWGACNLIGSRLNLSAEERSLLSSKQAKERVKNGTHHLLKRPDGTSITSDRVKNGTHHFLGSGEITRARNLKRVADGTNPFVSGELQRNLAKKLVAEGKHHFLGGSINQKMISEGRHTSQIKKICEHCNKSISINMFHRWHGDNCKNKNTT